MVSLCGTISSMKSTRQAGVMNLLLVPMILLVVVLMGVSFLAYSSYTQAQDYKNNVDAKVAAAVEQSNKTISDQKDKDFAQKEKYPYMTYVGPQSAGSIRIQYPKTWSAYIDAPNNRPSKPLEGWFAKAQVPSITGEDNVFALRVVVATVSYDSALKAYQAQQKTGKVTIQPYQSPNVPGVIGSRIDGEVKSKKQGSMILLPFRDKTLQMWTESVDYRDDFDKVILKNFSLTP
jgi:hypothetical protein